MASNMAFVGYPFIIGSLMLLFNPLLPGIAEKVKIKHFKVPTVADVREEALLECGVDLSNPRLESVKWYINTKEFYRYQPQGQDPVQSFPTPGINLDYSDVNVQHGNVKIKPLTFNATGLYKCEVSMDGPDFQMASEQRNMTVIVEAKQPPRIWPDKRIYREDDTVAVNCTSSPSYPEAHVKWYINDQEAPEQYVGQPTIQRISRKPARLTENTVSKDAAELVSMNVTRELRADWRIISPNKSTTVTLRCVTSEHPLKRPFEAKLVIRLEATSAGANLPHTSAEGTTLRGSTSALLQGFFTLLVALIRTSTATS